MKKAVYIVACIFLLQLSHYGFGAASIQAIPVNKLTAFRGDMLVEFQEEPHHRKGLGLSLEERVVGGVGDHRGFAVLL